MSVPNPSSPEIQKNNHDNLIPDNIRNDKTIESEIKESVLKYWQEHYGVDSDGINEFNQRHIEIFPVPYFLVNISG